MLFKPRIDKKFEQLGESFLLNGTTPMKGFFQDLDSGRARIYLDDIEIMSLTRPALLLVVPAGATIAVNNTIARDGRTYSVVKIAKERIKDEVVAQIAILN
jgi:hypothetical protein